MEFDCTAAVRNLISSNGAVKSLPGDVVTFDLKLPPSAPSLHHICCWLVEERDRGRESEKERET